MDKLMRIQSLSLCHIFLEASDPEDIVDTVVSMIRINSVWNLIGREGKFTLRVAINDEYDTRVDIHVYLIEKTDNLYLVEQVRQGGCAFNAYAFFNILKMNLSK